MGTIRDTGVILQGDSLSGLSILLGVSGGIAAVESVKVARELRRHGAEVVVLMSHSAQKIITPLALSWASASEVITDWEGEMRQLDNVDAVLVCPTTRHHMASVVQGMMDTPLLMALSAARGRKVPIMMVPSMHDDLAKDPITVDIESELEQYGMNLHWGPIIEGKRKQDNPISLVAAFCHFINKEKENRKSIVITLGATRSPIDDIRYVQNTSSGATGWAIAEDLHRHGHDVSVVAGTTTVQPAFPLPLVIQADDPDEMLKECFALSNDDIRAWVHCAAVLDYIVDEPKLGKFASQQGDWDVTLKEGSKHIMELQEVCKDSVRIGFKLETGVKISDLVHRALAQIKNSGMTAVIANRLEDLSNPNKPRAHLIDSLGEHWALQDNSAIAKAIRTLVER
jgi:phosphopantothenoylcysteine decarboxylase / phosphopantothenate---cysteine ligase